MDFTLSLAHFCETHGPVSILCTQAAPVSCTSCAPISTSSSFGGLASQQKDLESDDAVLLSTSGSFDFAEVHDSTAKEDGDAYEKERRLEHSGSSRHLNDLRAERRKMYEAGCETKYCVSCSIFAPQDIAQSLPVGCPGSFLGIGSGRNGSPILRSEEPCQVFDDDARSDPDTDEDEGDTAHGYGASAGSFNSRASSSHTHTLNYISTSNPIDPNIYSLFRKLVLRTMTGEELPRGLTSGKLAFDDATDRITVAYKFRLSDPYARGGYRFYALIALAGRRDWRAYRAVARIWERFQIVAEWLAGKVEENVANSRPPSNEKTEPPLPYLPVSSFLTGRDRPRTRGLTEMTGDERIFVALHLEFVSLQRELREMYQ